LKPAWANSLRDSISKKKKGLVKWLKVKALSSSPSIKKKKKRKEKKNLSHPISSPFVNVPGNSTEPILLAD
jgi:hypothetical protein